MTLRVAVVDDNAMDRQLATEAFSEACPACTVDLFSSGPAVLSHLLTAEVLPDVLLLDLNMPGCSGFEVLTSLKADPRLAQIPVVMFTTSSASRDVAEAYALHASSYVVKAPSFHAFLDQVEAFVTYWQLNRVSRAGPGGA